MAAPKLVEVTWGDAWESAEDCGHEPLITHSVGYVVERNKKGIRLAGCVDDDGEFAGRYVFVPSGMVKRVKVIRAGKD